MRQTTRLLIASSAIFLTACGSLPPHNNTLIFAVNRKVGIDISPTNAANAGLTIGYSSTELAWVPLWANDGEKKPMMHCVETDEITEIKKSPSGIDTKEEKSNVTTKKISKCPDKFSPKFVGKNADPGVRGKDEDAYSTFASFGGDIRADGASTNAGIKLASFFATGIAAQQLAEQGSSLTAVSDAYSATKVKLSDAVQQTKTNLLELFKLIALGDGKAASVPEKCFTTIGTEFDAKQEHRFDYLKDSTPQYAASSLITFNFTDDEYRKLGGIAYRHTSKIEGRIEQKKDLDKSLSKSQVARHEMNCPTSTDPAPVVPAPAAPASSPAPTASAPTT